MKRVAVFLAEGFETCEALIVVDLLRRAQVRVDTISISNQLDVLSSQQVVVQADLTLKESILSDYDVLFLPGGKLGTQNLETCSSLLEAYQNHFEQGKLCAAICAAPSILGHLGVLKGKNFTCFPGFEEDGFGGSYLGERVVLDGNVLTGLAMGASVDFGLKLVEILQGSDRLQLVKQGIQYPEK